MRIPTVSLDGQMKKIQGSALMREAIDTLKDDDEVVMLIWKSDEGRRSMIQHNLDTKSQICYFLGLFLHDEYEGRFDLEDEK